MDRKKTLFAALTVAFATLSVVGAIAFPAQQEHSSSKGTMSQTSKGAEASMQTPSKQLTLDGEVIDLYCYMNHPESATGPDHAKCAESCMKKGLPVGFLSNGEVYLLLGKDHESIGAMAAQFAGVQSRLTGTLITHHGVKGIDVASIEPLSKETPATTAPKSGY